MKLARPILLIVTVMIFASPLAAQESGGFISPIASPSEPGNLLRFPGDSQMDFGLALPLWMYGSDGKNSSWEVGLRPGIFSRFLITNSQLALRAADFRLGIHFGYRKGNWSASAELYHISSHRGADLQNAASPPLLSYSREALEMLVAYGHTGSWRVYAGPTVLVRTHPSLGRWTLEAGAEWFPKPLSRSFMRFYLAADCQTREEVHWRPNISVEPGLMFAGSIARVGAWLYSGQAPFGQFFQQREKEAGIQLHISLPPSPRFLFSRRK